MKENLKTENLELLVLGTWRKTTWYMEKDKNMSGIETGIGNRINICEMRRKLYAVMFIVFVFPQREM